MQRSQFLSALKSEIYDINRYYHIRKTVERKVNNQLFLFGDILSLLPLLCIDEDMIEIIITEVESCIFIGMMPTSKSNILLGMESIV